ncbi:hypothetical protein NA57DRAFT_51300 [Rhizodiscina lignyota]|uniref:F-box domain-containing protein n=1 Tax=Rhizodiscina lignyota TaxID=1504668 RepID=A0A9P4IU29_9PEZI|nr:hypothetical protein NA57DRAFT_51300 [Rhizodiscina lignyota]
MARRQRNQANSKGSENSSAKPLYSAKELQPYRRFPKLYGERKYAKNFTPQPFRLLDLPFEIREIIFRNLLILDGPIEFCPLSADPDKSDNLLRANSLRKGPSTCEYHRTIQPLLSVLRTCKLINDETAPMFYGENEFRFTGKDDWIILNAFLVTIGKCNMACIKRIAVKLPHLHEHGDEIDSSISGRWNLRYLLGRFGLQWPNLNIYRHCGAIAGACGLLELVQNLQRLTVVVSEDLDDEPAPTDSDVHDRVLMRKKPKLSFPLEAEEKFALLERLAKNIKGLKVTIILLQAISEDAQYYTSPGQDHYRFHDIDHADRLPLVRWARSLGWDVLTQWQDQLGRYPVEEEDFVCG